MKTLSSLAVTTLIASLAAPLAAATFDPNAVALTLANDGKSILTIAGQGTGTSVALTLDGAGTISLDDIDYRPKTGGVYGYDNETDSVYLVDVKTGTLTLQTARAGATKSDTLGFDFNNQIDAARIVTDAEENVVYNPKVNPQTLTIQTPLFYVPGDVNAGPSQDPTVIMNAYTNAVADAPSTVQYVIDTGFDVLATLNNNLGELKTVGKLFLDGVAFDARGDGGFDILSFLGGNGISNTAYALLGGGGKQTLYTFGLTAIDGRIDLMMVAEVPTGQLPVSGLTVVPAAVPVPATALLLFGALGLLGAVARRRRA